LVTIVTAYHDVLLYDRLPNFEALLNVMTLAIVLLIISLVIFRKANAEMVDQL